MNRVDRRPGVCAAACVCLALAGCAAPAAHREGERLLEQGQWQAGLGKLDEASHLDPSSVQYRIDAAARRDRTVRALSEQADAARLAGQPDEAKKGYEAVLALQPGYERALAGLQALARDTKAQAGLQGARSLLASGDMDGANAKLAQVLAEDSQQREALALKASMDASPGSKSAVLSAAFRAPISLEFHDAPLRAIFEVLSRTARLNFIFDRDIKLDQRASIYLRDSTIESALEFLAVTNQFALRPLDGNSLLIYPADAAKRKDYEPMGVRAFYLLNTDAKSFGATLKTILKSKDVVVDDKLNLVILHDTWDSIRLAEKLAALQDVAEPEVMLDVEVLEVKRGRLTDLGVHWPDRLTLSALPLSGGSTLTLSDLQHIGRTTTGVAGASATANLSAQDSDADILANPRIRTHSREKAKILIGERVPSPVSTTTSTGFVSESINYIDVGLKLDVEPIVYPNDEVSIQLGLEVSSINSQQTTTTGAIAYQIGTRNAQTVLRLRNNENTILAGLIDDEDRRSASAIPLLGDIPLIGHLFGEHTVDKAKTEIVLSITPHIVRNVPTMSLNALQFEAGTEAMLHSPVPKSMPVPAGDVAHPATGAGLRAPAGAAVTPGTEGAAPKSVGQTPVHADSDVQSAVAATQAKVRANLVGPASAKAGDEIEIDLDLQSDQPIVSVPISIGYDPRALDFMSMSEGRFLAQGGGSVDLKGDSSAGQVNVTERIVGGLGGLSQDHVLKLRFKVQPDAPASTKVQILSLAPSSAAGPGLTTPAAPLVLAVSR